MSLKRLKNRLERASREKDKALRGIRIAAVVTEALKKIDVEPILVGGSAVAFYTEGKYTTQDVDMLAPSGAEVNDIMSELGFSKLGKDFINKKLNVYVEFPGETKGPTEKINIIEVDNISLKIISIEDLLVDRLCAFKYWKSAIDGVNALMMLELGIADRIRVEERAREEDVLDALDYSEDVLEKVTRKRLTPTEASNMLNKFFKS